MTSKKKKEKTTQHEKVGTVKRVKLLSYEKNENPLVFISGWRMNGSLIVVVSFFDSLGLSLL